MFRSRINTFAFAVLLFAFAGFLFISAGGEFLHKKVHHHADQTSHDQCALFLLQAQLLTTILAAALVVLTPTVLAGRQEYRTRFSHSFLNLPYLRAPPVSL